MNRSVRTARRGLSLVEAVVSVVVVGAMLAAALNVAGAVGTQRVREVERQTARNLAAAMVAELRMVEYGGADTDFSSALVHGSNRQLYTTLDRFDGWEASPPVTRSGVEELNASRLTRGVTVSWFDPDSGADSSTPTGAKIARVTIKRGDLVLAERELVRTEVASAMFQRAWPADPAVIGDDLEPKTIDELTTGGTLEPTLPPELSDPSGALVK